MFFIFLFVPDLCLFFFFFFNDTATTEIYTLSLHDALPISLAGIAHEARQRREAEALHGCAAGQDQRACAIAGLRAVADRKSTRLNSSHANISYAVFCLKKKNRAAYLYTADS